MKSISIYYMWNTSLVPLSLHHWYTKVTRHATALLFYQISSIFTLLLITKIKEQGDQGIDKQLTICFGLDWCADVGLDFTQSRRCSNSGIYGWLSYLNPTMVHQLIPSSDHNKPKHNKIWYWAYHIGHTLSNQTSRYDDLGARSRHKVYL